MTSLADKLAAFREAAGIHGIQITVHPGDLDRPTRGFSARALRYGVLAGAVSAAAVSFALRAPELVVVDASTHHHHWTAPAPVLPALQQAPPLPPSAVQPEATDPWQRQELRELRERLTTVARQALPFRAGKDSAGTAGALGLACAADSP